MHSFYAPYKAMLFSLQKPSRTKHSSILLMPKCFFFFSPAFEGLVWKWLTLFKRVSRGGCKQIHREAHSIHFLHPPPNSYSICVVLQWVFQKLLSSLCTSLSSPLLCVCFTCAAVTIPPPLILLLPSFTVPCPSR